MSSTVLEHYHMHYFFFQFLQSNDMGVITSSILLMWTPSLRRSKCPRLFRQQVNTLEIKAQG